MNAKSEIPVGTQGAIARRETKQIEIKSAA